MATKVFRPRLFTPALRNLQTYQPRRTFLPNPFASGNPLSSQPQALTASRTLPYPHLPIYAIISDVNSYASFLPYCQSSTVTKWSAPDATYQRKWPSEGKMVIGWGNLTESFTSRIFCVPGKIVESVGGQTETDLDRRAIAHHLGTLGTNEHAGSSRITGGKDAENGLLTHLRSRWTIDPLPTRDRAQSEQTMVTLSLEFAFGNPLYTTLSAGVAPKLADVMIKAFEKRVQSLLHGKYDLAKASLADLGGSRAEQAI
ncbi:hypothetical protein CC78DRAFT_531763 [Lojkania enalia]|uniref:Coenzyme Q-binding protein COQ10 START domain-containing protein n=1 Tax=Lojkania enalia TaxID=147567 RepID=A0A9P4N1R1_9PLEO|nr:hypothetical protein CC78DRAFT_531763 [Didymosphaeria enalia]